ncbi:MAG: radical SAM protein [Treponema sp.]|nr:radical SAM protein [Treponema sp.]
MPTNKINAQVICTTLLVEKSPQALPLGAACIATAIKASELTKDLCSVSLVSFSQEDEDFLQHSQNQTTKAHFLAEKLLTKSLNCEKTIVCFSVFVWNRQILEETSQILRKKGVLTIAGGPEVTANPDSFTTFDYVVCGEGELSVPALLYKIISGKTAPNTSFDNCSYFSEEYSPYLTKTLNPCDYGGALWELARGCPFKCSYCYESKGEKTVRHFPVERIKKELDLFAKYDVPQVFVLDPTYNADKKQAMELLKLIAQKTPNTFYYFEARGEMIDLQLAQAFTKIPCALQIGLQSCNEEVLKLVHRPFNRKQFQKGIGFLNDAGVTFGLDLIFGLPGDSLKGFKESIDFAISLYPNNLEMFCLSVLPGTDLADRANELKLNFEPQAPYHIINTDRFSKPDIAIAEKLSKACTIFYNLGRAVPWFNSICKCLKMRPSDFFIRLVASKEYAVLYDEYIKESKNNCEADTTVIEKQQISFISTLLKEKRLDKLIIPAIDLIRFHGALSRTQATGKKEKIQLHYIPEYLDSQYASDLQFFAANVKQKNCMMETFKQNNYADYKMVKK